MYFQTKNFRRKLTVLFSILTLLMGLALSGCATMEPESIYNLKHQVRQLNKNTAELSKTNVLLEKKLSELQVNLANQGIEMSSLESEISGLSGKYETESHKLKEFEIKFRQYRLIVNRQLIKILSNSHAMPQGGLSSPAQPSSAGPSQTGASSSPVPPQNGVKEVTASGEFKGALDLFKKGKYPEAAAKLKEFLKKYPGSKYIPDASFYEGYSYFKNGEYPKSILELHKFTELYPKNPNVPMAVYLQGLGFLKISDPSDASILFRQVTSRYPGTRASKLSEGQLHALHY